MTKIGITERGDPVFDLSWLPWVKAGKPAILITKNSEQLLDICLDNLPDAPTNVIVHCTITGYCLRLIMQTVAKNFNFINGLDL